MRERERRAQKRLTCPFFDDICIHSGYAGDVIFSAKFLPST